jgi:hypothetical protein
VTLSQAEIQRLRAWFLTKAAPLPLFAVPDNWNNAASASPIWEGGVAFGGAAAAIVWRPADTTQGWARLSFKVPAGCSPQTPLRVRGLIIGTATSENIIITCYKSSFAPGDTIAWDTANSTEQTSIAVAGTYVTVTIATITPVTAGDVIGLAFRPRTPADATVTQNKVLEAVWLEA